MENRYSLVVASCDTYSDLWEPFFQLLKKNWPDFNTSIYLSTETKKIEVDGLDIRCPLNFHKKVTWSERMLALLEIIDTPHILFLLDDFWIKSAVKDEIINKCLNYLKNDKNIGYFCLKSEVQPRGKDFNYPSEEYPEFLVYGLKTRFRITTQVGLWRKDYLRKILRKHEDIWFFETRATWRSRYLYKERIYVLKPSHPRPIDYHKGGVVDQGKYVQEFLDDFSEENIKIDLTRGIVPADVEPSIRINKLSILYWWGVFKSMLPKN